jgi:hypothetical protein
MNERSDFDRTLRHWFDDGPSVMPDRLVGSVAARIARQPQRRAWRLQGRPNVNLYAKLAAAAAAALVVGFVGWRLLPANPNIGGQPTPAPTIAPPSVAPTASAEAYVCEEGTGCAGLLTAGTHSTAQFDPAFNYAVPNDWMNPIDVPTLVGLTPVDRPADLILVWSGVVPAETTAACTLQAKAGAGTSADDWVTYLTEHPGLDATNVQSSTIGGRTVRSVDVRSFGGWMSPCPDDRAEFNVPLLKTSDFPPGDGYGVRTGAMARIYAIEVGAETVVITVYSYSGSGVYLAAIVDIAAPVVTSLVFEGP